MGKGIITLKSNYSVRETIDKLVNDMNQKEMHIFFKIDFKAKASEIGIDILPIELLIFGKPQIGITLIQDNPIVAIDLPMKALVWEDYKGNTLLSYNDPQYLAERHELSDKSFPTLTKVSEMLNAIFVKVTT